MKISLQKKLSTSLLKTSGFSMVEMLIAVGVLSIVVLASTTMFENQSRANNFLEFQLKRTQLQSAIISQVLNNPINCECLFTGSTDFPVSGVALLAGVSPTAIGPYNFATPNDCSTATILNPLVNTVGVDSVKLNSVNLSNISNNSGSYSGDLQISIQSIKNALGPKDLNISIPVSISVSPVNPTTVKFKNCSLNSIPAAQTNINSCQRIIGPSTSLDNAYHIVNCPVNTAAVGFSVLVSSSGYMDGYVTLTCCHVGNQSWIGANTTRGDDFSTAIDNAEHTAFCNNDEFATGVSIYATSALDGRMTVKCNKFPGINLNTHMDGSSAPDGYTSSGVDSTYHVADCRSGLLQGIGIWSSLLFDTISRVKCGNLQ